MEPVERAHVERWSTEERARVARLLDEFIERPAVDRTPKLRLAVLALTCVGAAALIPWITFLSRPVPKT